MLKVLQSIPPLLCLHTTPGNAARMPKPLDLHLPSSSPQSSHPWTAPTRTRLALTKPRLYSQAICLLYRLASAPAGKGGLPMLEYLSPLSNVSHAAWGAQAAVSSLRFAFCLGAVATNGGEHARETPTPLRPLSGVGCTDNVEACGLCTTVMVPPAGASGIRFRGPYSTIPTNPYSLPWLATSAAAHPLAARPAVPGAAARGARRRGGGRGGRAAPLGAGCLALHPLLLHAHHGRPGGQGATRCCLLNL